MYQEGNPHRQAVVTLSSNGNMQVDHETGGHALETEWAVVGPHFWIGPRSILKQRLLALLSGPYFLATGESLVNRATRMRIFEVTSDEFLVGDDIEKSRFVYRRMTE